METDLKEVDKIMFNLRGNAESNCKINNPAGRCWHSAFNKMIEKTLGVKQERASNLRINERIYIPFLAYQNM